MIIRFLCDYIGRETAMKQYHRGAVGDFPFAQAVEIIRLGGAEEVIDEPAFEPLPKFNSYRERVSKPIKVKHEPNAQ